MSLLRNSMFLLLLGFLVYIFMATSNSDHGLLLFPSCNVYVVVALLKES